MLLQRPLFIRLIVSYQRRRHRPELPRINARISYLAENQSAELKKRSCCQMIKDAIIRICLSRLR